MNVKDKGERDAELHATRHSERAGVESALCDYIDQLEARVAELEEREKWTVEVAVRQRDLAVAEAVREASVVKLKAALRLDVPLTEALAAIRALDLDAVVKGVK